ncbi:MAG TPA: hypothetical protein VEL47_06400 [Myxococcota bacterium]|nr:hypothetical protein [Myxococcota bacterium]
MNRTLNISFYLVVAMASTLGFANYDASYERAKLMVRYVDEHLPKDAAGAKSEKSEKPSSTFQWVGSKLYEFGDMIRREDYQKVKNAARSLAEYQTGFQIGQSSWSWMSRNVGNSLRWVSKNMFYVNPEATKSNLLVEYIVENGAHLNLRKSDLAIALGLLNIEPAYDVYLEVINELKLRNHDLSRILRGSDTELQYAIGQVALLVNKKENFCDGYQKNQYPDELKSSVAKAYDSNPKGLPGAKEYIKNELYKYCVEL